MYALLFLAALPGQFVDNSLFPKTQQQVAYEATARIYHDSTRSAGTAVIVACKGDKVYLLTAAHLFDPKNIVPGREKNAGIAESHFYSATNPDKVTHVDARLVAQMPEVDLAVLETTLKNPPTIVPLCPPDKVASIKPPMTVMTIGALDGPPEIVIDEVKKRKVPSIPDRGKALYWEANIPQGKGRSGGPMIDSRGYVIGIASGTEHQKGYYISIDEILRSLHNQGLDWLSEKQVPKK